MNRKQLLERAIELKECSEEFESVTFLDSDTEFFADVVEIIQRTAQEVPVQEQLVECRNRKNISIKNEDGITKVRVDEKEIYGIRKLTFTHEAGGIPVVTLEVYPKILTVDSYLAFGVKTLFEKR